MALTNCSECGKQISDKALSCPHCGNPLNQSMKEDEYLCCPKCNSRELYANPKGFSSEKALVGAMIAGGVGLLAGVMGSQDVRITCLKCGNKFKAGEAVILKANLTEEEKIKNITRSKGKTEAIKYCTNNKNMDAEKATDYVNNVLGEPPTPRISRGCLITIYIFIFVILLSILISYFLYH